MTGEGLGGGRERRKEGGKVRGQERGREGEGGNILVLAVEDDIVTLTLTRLICIWRRKEREREREFLSINVSFLRWRVIKLIFARVKSTVPVMATSRD